MKKIIVFLAVLIPLFCSCEQNIFSPDADGITRFCFEDASFEYNWQTHVMSGVNPSESGGTFLFIINDCRVDERAGNRLRLGPYSEDSYTRFYDHGVNLLVEYSWDGISDHFYMTLD